MIQDPFKCLSELASMDADDARDIDARRICEYTLPDGKWVSTVRLPFSGKQYETAVFESQENLTMIDVETSLTLDAAKEAHRLMVEKWKKISTMPASEQPSRDDGEHRE